MNRATHRRIPPTTSQPPVVPRLAPATPGQPYKRKLGVDVPQPDVTKHLFHGQPPRDTNGRKVVDRGTRRRSVSRRHTPGPWSPWSGQRGQASASWVEHSSGQVRVTRCSFAYFCCVRVTDAYAEWALSRSFQVSISAKPRLHPPRPLPPFGVP